MPNDVTLDPFKSSQARRNYIQYNIGMDVWNKHSANDILDALKAVDMGIRRTDFLSIRREVLGIQKFQEKLEALPNESLVPKAYMQDKSPLRMTNNMQYRFSVLGYDPETEERTIYTRAVSTNEWMTKEQAQEFIEGLFLFPTENSNYIVEDIMISEVWVQDLNRLQ